MTEDEFKRELEELLNKADPIQRKKLEGLQWKLDLIRAKHGDNHTGCMVEIFKLMFEEIGKLQQILNEPSEYMKNVDKGNNTVTKLRGDEDE